MQNHILSNASTTKSLPARLALAPFGLWSKLSHKLLPIILPSTEKTTLILLLPPLYPRAIFLHQSLPPIPTWMTKGSYHITSPLQKSLCHPLSYAHEKVSILQVPFLDVALLSGDQGYYSCSSEACQNNQKLNSFLPFPIFTA